MTVDRAWRAALSVRLRMVRELDRVTADLRRGNAGQVDLDAPGVLEQATSQHDVVGSTSSRR